MTNIRFLFRKQTSLCGFQNQASGGCVPALFVLPGTAQWSRCTNAEASCYPQLQVGSFLETTTQSVFRTTESKMIQNYFNKQRLLRTSSYQRPAAVRKLLSLHPQRSLPSLEQAANGQRAPPPKLPVNLSWRSFPSVLCLLAPLPLASVINCISPNMPKSCERNPI